MGYRRDFAARAALSVKVRVTKAFDEAGGIRADIEPFPVQATEKGLLRIIVQGAERQPGMSTSTG